VKRRVVVTGMGTINPLGPDVKSTWDQAQNGTNGISTIERIDTDLLDVHIAGEVKGFDPAEAFGKKRARRLDRFTQFALKATQEAVEQSELNMDSIDKSRAGVFYSSGIGGLETISNQQLKANEKGYQRISPFFIPMAIINIAAGTLAIEYDFHGASTASVTACASATNTIGDAFRSIRDGYHDVVIAGGSEASITPMGLGGFNVMQALAKTNDPNNASRPFDKNRSGFVMGEGAGTLILETLEHATERGATIYGEIVGYGSTSDAYHITSPDPQGKGAAASMRYALSDAGITPKEIQYINAHGTSTPLNDQIETKAIKEVFEDNAHSLNISSTKSMVGHLLGASGALESILSLKALQNGIIPPTINYETPDENCDLNYTPNQAVKKSLTHALSNSLGFGGHNATLVFKRWED